MPQRRVYICLITFLLVGLLLSACDSLPLPLPPFFDLSELQIPSFRFFQTEGLPVIPEDAIFIQEEGEDVQISVSDAHELQEVEGLEWFMPSNLILSYWDVAPVSDDPPQISLQLKEPADEAVDILFLYTASHPVFDRAVSQVLGVFLSKRISANASVALIDTEDVDQAMSVLTDAEAKGYDLVYTVGSKTTAFVHENYQGGALPVVTVLSKDPVLLGQMLDYESGSGTNIAYTSVSVPVELQMSYMRQLVPRLEQIIVVYDENNASTVQAQVEPLDHYVQGRGIDVLHVAVSDEEDAEAQIRKDLSQALLKASEDDPDIKYTIVLVTSSQTVEENFDTINELATGFPIASLFNEMVREGPSSALVSISASFDSNAILAGLYGVRILEGEDPGSLPVGVVSPPDVRINFLKARQIGLQIPFSFFENASIIFGPDGSLVRDWSQ